jgi:hypothetical protein
MNDPTHRGLRGDLWAQARFAQLTEAGLGEPQSGPETELLVLLSRLLSDAEVELLVGMVRRVADLGEAE